jgi:biopolymer transport protein TolR
MNAAQVRAKARTTVKRREEEIETEEIEGGELNLVPYLDIVTNIMLFLLATVTSGLLLGTINSSLPEYAAGAGGLQGPAADEEPPIQLVVAITRDQMTVFSISGLEGTLKEPKLRTPARKPAKDDKDNSEYDYAKLTEVATEIVERRWKDMPMLREAKGGTELVCLDKDSRSLPKKSCRPETSTQVVLMVDDQIPYQVVTRSMDALRENAAGRYLFPNVIFSSGIQ